jgi:hypothetical protein
MRCIRLKILSAMMALGMLGGCGGGTAGKVVTGLATAVTDGQLFCATAPGVVALATLSGSTLAPVLAKGASSAYVQRACGIVQGVAVAPPTTGAVPIVTIPAVTL